MNKERLEELRTLVWADHECLTETGNHGGYHADLLALIDAEIERQSVTDEDVQRAIEELSKSAWRIVRSETDYRPDFPRLVDDDVRQIAITALRQMRTSAPDVFGGIEPCEWCTWTDKGYRIEHNLIDEDGNYCPDMDDVVVNGIAHYCPNCGRYLGGGEN